MFKRLAAALVIGSLVAGGAAVHGATATTGPAAMGPSMLSTQTVMLHPMNMSTVDGVATLTYDPHSKTTTVTLTYFGVSSKNVHPAHLHLGSSCSANGPVAYAFKPLQADSNGIATETLTFPAKIFGSGVMQHYYINLHQGPGLAGKQFTVIACGVVNNM